MNIFEFMAEHPILTFLLVWIVCSNLVELVSVLRGGEYNGSNLIKITTSGKDKENE